jgi:hypothetical protein
MDTAADVPVPAAIAAAEGSGIDDLVDPDTLEFLRAMPADERLAFAHNLGLPEDMYA